jgi:hypothetical protein
MIIKVVTYSLNINSKIPDMVIHNYMVNLIRDGYALNVLLKNMYKVYIKITIRGHINYLPIWTI